VCVLVVEADPVTRVLAAECLEDAGHDVMTAEHGLEAITLIEAWPAKFSILVTGCHMPYGFTGRQLVQHMRRSYPGIPMLITTALPDAVTPEFRERHKVEMLAKPYNLNSLVTMVGRLLGRTPTG
jgi:CheY-like chemotaxis protein